MISRAGCAIVFVSVAVVVGIGALPRAQPPQRRPQFRTGVEYVEVDVRVVDAKGQPIRDLTQRDFRVVEDGVSQKLETFSVVDLPLPSPSDRAPTIGVKPDVATNVLTSTSGRTWLIVVDDASIGQPRTPIVRKLLRQFIERSIGPNDLVAMTTTGLDAAYENFTNDKARLLAAVEHISGQGLSPTIESALDIANQARLRDGPGARPSPPNEPIASATTAVAFRTQRQLTRLVQAMGAAEGGSKAIILVSESIPFETVNNTEGLMLVGDVERLSTAARRGNVPVYPVDPRGLSDGTEESIVVGLIGANSPDPALRAEVRRGQERLRVMADDSGGVPIVATNSLAEGLDRVVSLSSYYYVLGYYTTNSRADGRYRRIAVSVDRPDAHAVHRRGYTAAIAGGSAGVVLAGPPGSSNELRRALNAVLPVDGLPLAMSAAAFRQANGRASVAVVLETTGSQLAWRNDALAAPVEMTAVAIEKHGDIKTGDSHRFQLPTSGDAGSRIRQFGFRWLARLDDLKPGRYQIRGAVANGPGKQGSVWHEVEIPDFAKTPLAMSDVILVADTAIARPTLRPDPRLAGELPGPPTTLREFPEGGAFALYAEVYDNQPNHLHDLVLTVVVADEHGETKFRTTDTRTSRQLAETRGEIKVKVDVPLAKMPPGLYTLSVDAAQAANRTIAAGRAVPFTVVRAGLPRQSF